MKKLAFILALFFEILPVSAYNLDLSVDNEIQKKYDSNKLNQDMKVSSPDKIIKNTETKQNKVSKSANVPKSAPQFDEDSLTVTADNYNPQKDGIYIPKRTHFKVKSNQKISNWSGINSSVTFTSTSPVYKKAVSIPVGTVFKGYISKVHQPQITGNGALVEIRITNMILNGKSIPVDGKITKANSEFVFFNKIKGDRQYINGVEKKINSANNFYKKSRQTSNKLSQNPVGTILSPIPTIIGFVGATAATIVSPVTGLVEKGKGISFPAGTSFEIKLLENAYII
mgnify:CR=1 FL=1